MRSSQIKCGGGLFLLSDGTFSYFVELHLQDSVFNFEHLNTFPTEDEAESEMNLCISAFPEVVAQAATQRNYELVEDFCDKWKLIKIQPEEKVPETEEDGKLPLH